VLGVLRVNRCKWWSDAFVVAVLSGAETATGVTRWDTLSMSHTAVTRAAVTSCWSAGVAVVDVSWCEGVVDMLDLCPTWVKTRVAGGEGGKRELGRGVEMMETEEGGEGWRSGGEAPARSAVARGGGATVAPSVAGSTSDGWRAAAVPDALQRTPRTASLNLCGTRLSHLRVSGSPRAASLLDINAAQCVELEVVDLSATSLASANFSECSRLGWVSMLAVLATGGAMPAKTPGRSGGRAGGARAASTATIASVGGEPAFPLLTVLSFFGCRRLGARRLHWTGAAAPALLKLAVSRVDGLRDLHLSDLPLLTCVDVAGYRDLDNVSIVDCPVLRRVDLRGKRAPLSRLALSLRAGGNVLGIREAWYVWTMDGNTLVENRVGRGASIRAPVR